MITKVYLMHSTTKLLQVRWRGQTLKINPFQYIETNDFNIFTIIIKNFDSKHIILIKLIIRIKKL